MPGHPEPTLRILLVTPFLPDSEATHGGGLYLGSLAAALARHAELGLATLFRPGEASKIRALPWRWSGGADYRGTGRGARHKARMLWTWGALGLPLLVAKHWQPEFVQVLRRARAEFAPDAALVELAPMAQYLPALEGLPTVFTDHEAGAPRESATELGAFADRRDERLWRRYVQDSFPQADLLQALTGEDAAALSRVLGRPVLRRPPVVPLPEQRVAPERAPPRALFFGDYDHHPNPEAARILVRRILPRLRSALPAAELWLAGPNQHRIADLQGAEGVRLLGLVPDLHGLLGQARLLLGPLWSGGGFRMKGLTALAHGLPVVTNQLGAQGVEAPDPARVVAEDDAALAEAALRLLRDPAAAARAGEAAFAWARANVSADAVAKEQVRRIAGLLAERRPSA